jgi:leucyl/phenylalanyl-tRNA--protein transferase
MADPFTARIEWFSPDPRAILPLDRMHVPRTLARAVRGGRFSIRSDTAFEAVMRACAAPRRDDPLTWIDERLVHAYGDLFERGHAHSVEAWLGETLVGGLYGVHVGAAFFGESMFIRPDRGGSQSSKVCLVHLVRWLRHRGFMLLDIQFRNPHLEQFGCIEIPRDDYLRRLEDAVDRAVSWGAFRVLPD